MKRISTLVVLAVAGLLVTAALGSATASAQSTVLCETERAESEFCPKADVMPAGTYFHTGSGGQKGKGITITSNGSTLYYCKGTYMAFGSTAESAPYFLPATFEANVEWSTCTSSVEPAASCSSASVVASGATLNPWGPNGALIRAGTASPLTISVTCTPGATPVTCEYVAKGVVTLEVDPATETAVTPASGAPLKLVKQVPSWYPSTLGCQAGSEFALSINHITHSGPPYVSVIQ